MLLISKMIDFQKNVQAEHVIRELANLEPDHLALFGLEHMFKMECTKTATLNLIKVFLEKHDDVVQVIQQIIPGSIRLRNEILELLKFQKKTGSDLSESTLSLSCTYSNDPKPKAQNAALSVFLRKINNRHKISDSSESEVLSESKRQSTDFINLLCCYFEQR